MVVIAALATAAVSAPLVTCCSLSAGVSASDYTGGADSMDVDQTDRTGGNLLSILII